MGAVQESWRRMASWPYEVSSLGRVRRVGGRVLKPYVNTWGYRQVDLYRDGKRRQAIVHRLVAMAFCARPAGADEVNHINGDKGDNRACNLEWVTHSQNVRHAFMTGLNETTRERLAEMTRRAVAQRRKAVRRSDGTVYESAQAAADAVGVGRSSITKCCRGGLARVQGYGYEYLDGAAQA